ncbi:MAG TPA: extracellular solute-binding protein [Tepidisphaeraceae bacterium]|jgi:multiple sugar transport system permease protein
MILVVVLVAVVATALVWLLRPAGDQRETIVFWGHPSLGDDIYTLIHEFERVNPQYRVVMGTAVAQDPVGDSQRLLSAIAGGVPPDVVWFDRFATGEWAGRGALTDLTPYLEQQNRSDPTFIDVTQYYPWALEEASYKPPGSDTPARVFGIPTEVDVRIFWANSDILRANGYVDGKGEPVLPKNWEELRAYANKLTRYKVPGNKSSGIDRLGFAPRVGNSWLYLYAWQAGGEFLSPNRTRCTMDSPAVVRALRWMTELYDDLGGVGQVTGFEEAMGGGAMDPFVQNMLAMKTDVSTCIDRVADWRPDMDFVVGEPPMPADRVEKGPVSWSGGFALVIPATAKQKDAAFKFIQFLYSWDAINRLEQGKREQKQSEGKLYLPKGLANRVFFERLIKQHITDNKDVPRRIREAYDVIQRLMTKTRIRPVTPVGQLLWNQHVRATDLGNNHVLADEAKRTGQDEYELALKSAQQEVQQALDQVMAPPPPHRVNWTNYFLLYAAGVAMPFVMMGVVYRRRKKSHSYSGGEVRSALLFASPWMAGMILFIAGPILFSIIFSFTRYDVLSPARYVGMENYTRLLNDALFYKSIVNTAYMLIRIPLGMAVSLAIALALNKALRGIGVYRTGFYLPAIMPLVASSLLWMWIFNPSYGVINSFLEWMYATAPMQWIARIISYFVGAPFHFTAPLWLQSPQWSKPALIIMGLWTAGGGMIIWLAGLQSIPQQLYEAAAIDGANRWNQFRHVTLPMLSPYILFNLIIGVIGTMQIFQEAFIMTHGGTPADSTMFYAYNLFQQAFQYFRMGYASAMAWILFVIVLALTLLQLWLSRRWVHYDRT